MGDQFKPVISAYGSLSQRTNKVLVPVRPQHSLKKDQFKPVISAYGSLSNTKNKVLVPVKPQHSSSQTTNSKKSTKILLTKPQTKVLGQDGSQHSLIQSKLKVVPTVDLTALFSKETKEPASTPLVVTLPDVDSDDPAEDPASTRRNSVDVLDDGVITLSPDLVPFSIPVELTQKTDDKVLAVVTLDELPSSKPEVDTSQASDDPLEVVITLEDSDSSPSVMDPIPSPPSHPIDDLMEQVRRLVEKHEQDAVNRTKVIAKLNARLTKADQDFVQSEAFASLVRSCVQKMERGPGTMYTQLKKILDKLKSSTDAPSVEPIACSSTSSTNPIEHVPSASARTSSPSASGTLAGTSSSNVAGTLAGTSNSSVPGTSAGTSDSNVAGTSARTSTSPPARKVIKPITLESEGLKHYDKQNYVKAMELFEQLVSIVEDTEPDKTLSLSVISKLRTRLANAEKKYLYSRVFLQTLAFSINGLLKDPSKMYGFIRKTSDELKANMKCLSERDAPGPSSSKQSASQEGQNPDEDPDAQLDDKTRLKIRKLEKSLKQIVKIIDKLDSEELLWGSDEEDENSAYIRGDKYMQRYMKIYEKICELRKRRVSLGRPTHSKIRFEATEYAAVNKTIEKFYNSTREFPDYGDMLSLVQKVSDTKQLHLSSATVQHVAEKAFTSLGEILKHRRLEDDYDIFLSRLGTQEDPANEDEELARKLEDNKKHWKKIDEVINEYVILQEEKKKSGEPDEEESAGEKEEDDDEDKEKDSTDRDNENSDANSDESDDYKENRGSSDEEDSDRSETRTKSKISGEALSNLLAKFDIAPCCVDLEDCVALYQSSPDKEASFFKYLKLAKLNDERDSQAESDEDKDRESNKRDTLSDVDRERISEVKKSLDVDAPADESNKASNAADAEGGSKASNAAGVEGDSKTSELPGVDTREKASKESEPGVDAEEKASKESEVNSKKQHLKRKLDLDCELSQDSAEDQNSIVTSTTDPEVDKPLSEEHPGVDSAGTSLCEHAADKSADSIPCVTSSVDHDDCVDSKAVDDSSVNENLESKPADEPHLKEKLNVTKRADEPVVSEKLSLNVDSMSDQSKPEEADDTVADADDTVADADDTVADADDSVADADDTVADMEESHVSQDGVEADVDATSSDDEDSEATCVEHYISKEALKSQLHDHEDVDKVFSYLSHCQVELVPVDTLEPPAECASDELEHREENEETMGNEDMTEINSEDSVEKQVDSEEVVDDEEDNNEVVDNEDENIEREVDNEDGNIEREVDNEDGNIEREVDNEDGNIEREVDNEDGNIEREVDNGDDNAEESNEKEEDNEQNSNEENNEEDSNEKDNEEDSNEKEDNAEDLSEKEDSDEDGSKDTNEKSEKSISRHKKKAEKRRLSSESEDAPESDDAEACGIPSRLKAKLAKPNESSKAKSKATASSKRKRESSSSEEEEEEEVSSGKSDSSDEDFNPYEEARAIRSMREQSGRRAQKKRKPQKVSSSGGSSRYPQQNSVSGRTIYSPGPRSFAPKPNAPSTSGAGFVPNKFQPRAPSATIPNLPRGITITPRVAPANVLPNINLKNITISRSGEKPSSTSQGFQPRPTMGPASRFGPRPQMGPASSKFRPQMGPTSQRPQTGPASARFRSNFGPPPGQRAPMGPASSKFGPRMGPLNPRSQMGPASAFRSNAPQNRTISENNMNKTMIKGGVQVQWNKMQASQAGTVNTLQRETNISSRQRLAGSVHSQKIHMKHNVLKDADSGAGQESRVTSNVQRTVTKDGRQIIRKVKKTITTNVEVEEIVIDPGEVIDID